MCTICSQLRPQSTNCDYAGLDLADAAATGTSTSSASLPTYSLDQVAGQLTDGYWESKGGSWRAFDVSPGDTLTYNFSGLTLDGKNLAKAALQAWSDVTGINFVSTSSSADITFNDNESGAFGGSTYSGHTILFSEVNVSTAWLQSYGTSMTSYSYQTYLHEIGHALGLGHGGNYNGSGNYASDAHYANDSWQVSLMSYFSQSENPAVDASYAIAVTPMLADIIAIQDLYGTPTTVRTGDTTYGDNATDDGNLDLSGTVALTIYDNGGVDTIDLGSSSSHQRIDLAAEAISDFNGKIGNLAIARGTDIENAVTGGGNDTVTGNGLRNTIETGDGDDRAYGMGGFDILDLGAGDDYGDGGSGQDTLLGGAGKDTLFGGGARDHLEGGDGADRLVGQGGNDTLIGGIGRDRLFGSAGNDTILAGSANDLINGGSGNDTMTGGNGNDTFVFKNGFGNDVITDFDWAKSNERLDLSGVTAITSYADLTANHMAQSGNDVVISDGGHSITLEDTLLSDLGSSDFLF